MDGDTAAGESYRPPTSFAPVGERKEPQDATYPTLDVSGPDPYQGDRLGRLGLTREGLARRDHLVVSSSVQAGIPVVVTLAGGYAATLDETVEIHCATVRTAARLFKEA